MVSLWDLMTLLCVGLSLGGAMGSASASKATLNGHILAIAAGLAIGLTFAWMMRRSGTQAAARIRKLPGASQERYFRLLYLAAALWIVLGFGLSAVAATVLIHVL